MEHGFIVFILIGGVAGWLARVMIKGGGFGLLIDIILGVVGAFVGGWLAGVLGVHIGNGILGSLFTATTGAVVLLLLARLFRRE